MFLTIAIALISLLALVTLHELGHFLMAKKFGVKVDEFGIGYPPRLLGKQFGGTFYSLNLLPFGAFVRIHGESSETDGEFIGKPVWQRALIILAGVLSFWAVAAVLLSFVFLRGTFVAIDDEETTGFSRAKVLITAVSPQSPAEIAGLKVGDNVVKAQSVKSGAQSLDKVINLQDFITENKGEEIVLTIERGRESLEITVIPRVSPPAGEGALGVGLVRAGIKSYPWYEAPWQGILTTGRLTVAVVEGLTNGLILLFKGAPTGIELVGPIGILGFLAQASQMGISYYLQFIAMISINVAVINILPLPPGDGGKLLFLGIEFLRRKPVNKKIEEGITNFLFIVLLLLMLLVTFKDVSKIIRPYL